MTELMIPWVPTAKYFKVLCRIGINRPDTTSDTDSHPNLMTQGGSVVISATVSKFRYTESDGRSRVVYIPPQDTYMIQASTGELFDADGNFHVYLLDTSSPGVDPQGFSYKATIRPNSGDPITVNIPGNPDLPEFDLANAVPITPSEGSPALVGRVAVLEEQIKDVSVYPVQQVLLSSNLAYTLPDDAPSNQVISVVFRQPAQAPTGYTVTYGGQPVDVDLAPNVGTTVEFLPTGAGHVVRYPVGAPAKVVLGRASDSPAMAAARINAALAAAKGSDRAVRLGGAYSVNAPLVIPSGVTLDARGATVTLVPGSNCNLVTNEACTSGRRINDAVMSAGSATLTSATGPFSSGDVGRPVRVHGAGPGIDPLDATITAYTSATTVTLSVPAVTAVNGQYAHVGTRDADITILGGDWIRDVDNELRDATHKGWDSNTLRLRHVDGLTIVGLSLTTRSGKYAVSVGDVTAFHLREVVAKETSSDLIHVNGPARDGFIGDTLSLGSGDDIVSMTAGDFVVQDTMGDTNGHITDVFISRILTHPSTHANKYTRAALVLAGQTKNAAHQFHARRITIEGVHSHLNATPVFVGADDYDVGTQGGTYADIKIRNVVNEPVGAAPTQVVLLKDGAMSGIEVASIRGTGSSYDVLVGAAASISTLSTDIPRSRISNGGTVSSIKWLSTPLPYGKPSTGRFETVDRRIVRDAVALASGTIRFTHFRPDQGQTVTTLRSVVATPGAGTTLAKVGIYRLSTDGSTWTKVGESFSSGTIWQTTGVKNPNLSATITVDPLRLYAVAHLWVGTDSSPALAGAMSILGGAELGSTDSLSKVITGQTDLPATIAATSVVDGDGAVIYTKGY